MEIVDHALHALSDEVMVPHSGWERGMNGAGAGEENCKPRHLEWETALTNTAGCLRYGGDLMMGRRSETEGRFMQTREEHGSVPTEQTDRAVGCMRREESNELTEQEEKQTGSQSTFM